MVYGRAWHSGALGLGGEVFGLAKHPWWERRAKSGAPRGDTYQIQSCRGILVVREKIAAYEGGGVPEAPQGLCQGTSRSWYDLLSFAQDPFKFFSASRTTRSCFASSLGISRFSSDTGASRIDGAAESELLHCGLCLQGNGALMSHEGLYNGRVGDTEGDSR